VADGVTDGCVVCLCHHERPLRHSLTFVTVRPAEASNQLRRCQWRIPQHPGERGISTVPE